MNKVYYLEHNGHYLGGVIFVVESSIGRAKCLIEKELLSAYVDKKEFNLDHVKEVYLSQPSVVYLFNGDY